MNYNKIYKSIIILTIIILLGSLFYKNCSSEKLTVSEKTAENMYDNKNNQKNSKTDENSKNIKELLKDERFKITGNNVYISEDIRNQFPIHAIQIRPQNFNEELEFLGTVIADPDRTSTLGTRLPGRVVKIYKKEGDWVKKGDLIVTVDSPDVAKLRADYQAAKSKMETSQKNFERVEQLTKNKLASDQEKRNAETEAKTWHSQWKSLRESLVLQGISADGSGNLLYFKSPISGKLLERLVSPGEPVSENTNLVRIGDLNVVWFQISLFEKDLSHVKLGQNVKIRLNAYPEEEFKGNIDYIASQLDPSSRSLPTRITVKNSQDKIKLGLSGKAILSSNNSDSSKNSENEPKQSTVWKGKESMVLEIEGMQGVFVSVSDLEYKWVPIAVIGKSQDSFYWRELTDETISDEEIRIRNVVDSGGYQLKSLFLKSGFGEEE